MFFSDFPGALFIAASVSLDAFAAGFAYGAGRTHIPLKSALVINLICSGAAGLSVFAGAILKSFLPGKTAMAFAAGVLFLTGIFKLLDGVTKSLIKKRKGFEKRWNGSFFNLKFMLRLYADPEAADVDFSKSISVPEAVFLSLALSLDGAAAGFGAAFAGIGALALVLCSLFANAAFLSFGHFAGKKIAQHTRLDLAWLGGAALIVLAFSKLL